jgi:hypothetical protein
VLKAMVTELESWLTFFGGSENLSSAAAHALASGHSRDDILVPLERYSSLLVADNYEHLSPFNAEERRQILAELQSLRRLEFLMSELNQYLARVPGKPSQPVPSLTLKAST